MVWRDGEWSWEHVGCYDLAALGCNAIGLDVGDDEMEEGGQNWGFGVGCVWVSHNEGVFGCGGVCLVKLAEWDRSG